MLSHFIRGYFDGDGTIKRNSKSERNVQVGFASSHYFIHSLNNVLNKEAKTNIITPYSRGNYSELTYGGKGNAKKLYDYMYQNATIFLTRKRKVYKIP